MPVISSQQIVGINGYRRIWRREARRLAQRRNLGALTMPALAVGLLLTGLCSVASARHLRDQGDDSGSGRPAGFTAGIDAMIRTCDQQADALKKLPLDLVTQTVRLTPEQRDALEQIRNAAAGAAASLTGACPKNISAQLSGKLQQLDDVLRSVADSLRHVRPSLAAFYGSLDDEQKAELVIGLAGKRTTEPEPKSSRKDRAAEAQASAGRKSMCADWEAKLRNWPVRQIDAGLSLSDMQRAALYDLSAAIYRSAGDLAEACPAESRVTPLSRMSAQEDELRALRQDMQAIRPFVAAFESTLNDAQKKRLQAAVEASASAAP